MKGNTDLVCRRFSAFLIDCCSVSVQLNLRGINDLEMSQSWRSAQEINAEGVQTYWFTHVLQTVLLFV